MMMNSIKSTVQLLLVISVLGLLAACVAVEENDPRLKAHQEAIKKGKERTQWINAVDKNTETKPAVVNKGMLETKSEANQVGKRAKPNTQNTTSKKNTSNQTNQINKVNPTNSINQTNRPNMVNQQNQMNKFDGNSRPNSADSTNKPIKANQQNQTKKSDKVSQPNLVNPTIKPTKPNQSGSVGQNNNLKDAVKPVKPSAAASAKVDTAFSLPKVGVNRADTAAKRIQNTAQEQLKNAQKIMKEKISQQQNGIEPSIDSVSKNVKKDKIKNRIKNTVPKAKPTKASNKNIFKPAKPKLTTKDSLNLIDSLKRN